MGIPVWQAIGRSGSLSVTASSGQVKAAQGTNCDVIPSHILLDNDSIHWGRVLVGPVLATSWRPVGYSEMGRYKRRSLTSKGIALSRILAWFAWLGFATVEARQRCLPPPVDT